MTQTIVFDTNYLRSFGSIDYLAGVIPDKLNTQIKRAVDRDDLVVLVDTVRTETNAWLEEEYNKIHNNIENAIQLLCGKGYTVTPNRAPDSPPPDIFNILQLASKKCTTLSPTIDDYREAERRTSYKQPPLPKKPEGEEMRDRVIWCQMLRWSRESNNPVLVVSADKIFKNGAESAEGIQARIKVVEGEVDLDQHLGERPEHIAKLIRSILTFAPELKEKGINLTETSIVGVEELRKVRETDGSVTQKFFLLTSGVDNLDVRCATTINIIGDQPHSIVMATKPPLFLARKINEQDMDNSAKLTSLIFQVRAINELRHLLRSR